MFFATCCCNDPDQADSEPKLVQSHRTSVSPRDQAIDTSFGIDSQDALQTDEGLATEDDLENEIPREPSTALSEADREASGLTVESFDWENIKMHREGSDASDGLREVRKASSRAASRIGPKPGSQFQSSNPSASVVSRSNTTMIIDDTAGRAGLENLNPNTNTYEKTPSGFFVTYTWTSNNGTYYFYFVPHGKMWDGGFPRKAETFVEVWRNDRVIWCGTLRLYDDQLSRFPGGYARYSPHFPEFASQQIQMYDVIVIPPEVPVGVSMREMSFRESLDSYTAEAKAMDIPANQLDLMIAQANKETLKKRQEFFAKKMKSMNGVSKTAASISPKSKTYEPMKKASTSSFAAKP